MGKTRGLRVCLYLEANDALTTSGFGQAFRNHLKALRRQKISVTTNPRADAYDLLHLHAALPKSFYFLAAAKARGVPVIAHAHTVGAHDFRNSYTLSNALAPLYEDYLKFFYNASDHVFTPTAFARRYLRRHGVTKPIAVISNGVDRERFTFSAAARAQYRRRFKLKRFTVFGAGNLILRKGVVTFLNVAEQLPDFDFIWFGRAWPQLLTFQPTLHARLEHRPANVVLPGFAADAPATYAAADALLFPSLAETQGLVILEAASLGRPLVVRDLPEYRGWLIHGVNCLTAKTDRDFIRALRRLAADEVLAARLRRGALALAEANGLDIIGQRLVELYQQVLKARHLTAGAV